MTKRVRQIEYYHSARELDESEWAAFLDVACTGNEGLRREADSDSTLTVGDPLYRNAAGYFTTLYIDSLVESFSISPELVCGQLQPRQSMLIHTFVFPMMFPSNFSSPTVGTDPTVLATFTVFTGAEAGMKWAPPPSTSVGNVGLPMAGFTVDSSII